MSLQVFTIYVKKTAKKGEGGGKRGGGAQVLPIFIFVKI